MSHQPKSEFLRVMIARGFMQDCTDLQGLDEALRAGVVPAYIGYDATAASLHVGHLMNVMVLRWLQKCGHKPITLMGGGTTKVGDPSFRADERPLLSPERIDANIATMRRVFAKYLSYGDGPADAVMLNNATWLDGLNYLDFLRDVGRFFSVNRMLSFESVKSRLDREQSLSFLEFNYMILQAYDFMELNRRTGCRLQMGGSDQWGNIVNGIDLTRRMTGAEVFGLVTPLLTRADGSKMGKTADGAVWLNEEMLSPYEFWQFWRNTMDADVGRFLRLYTELPLGEIARLEALAGSEINAAKIVLANEATAMCHGRAAAEAAEATARADLRGRWRRRGAADGDAGGRRFRRGRHLGRPALRALGSRRLGQGGAPADRRRRCPPRRRAGDRGRADADAGPFCPARQAQRRAQAARAGQARLSRRRGDGANRRTAMPAGRRLGSAPGRLALERGEVVGERIVQDALAGPAGPRPHAEQHLAQLAADADGQAVAAGRASGGRGGRHGGRLAVGTRCGGRRLGARDRRCHPGAGRRAGGPLDSPLESPLGRPLGRPLHGVERGRRAGAGDIARAERHDRGAAGGGAVLAQRHDLRRTRPLDQAGVQAGRQGFHVHRSSPSAVSRLGRGRPGITSPARRDRAARRCGPAGAARGSARWC